MRTGEATPVRLIPRRARRQLIRAPVWRQSGWTTFNDHCVLLKIMGQRDVHVNFGVLSGLTDLKPTKTIVTRVLATIPAAREAADRARGATAAQLSVKARMRVRIPPGPFSHSVEKIYTGERTQR